MKNAEEILKVIFENAGEHDTPKDIALKAMHEYAEQSRWVKVSERLPEFDVNVLVYWKLEKSKTNGGGYYDMIEIASISSISHGKDWQSVEWRDSEYNSVNPTHWMELHTPPKD